MMPVRALTIESPVTTVYRMAPKAAAATVPMAYSTVIAAMLMCLDCCAAVCRISIFGVAVHDHRDRFQPCSYFGTGQKAGRPGTLR